jgi:SpoVK/Ycf46/Vps4 family AAA+-type ATPase
VRFAGKDAVGRRVVAAALARAFDLKVYRVDLSGVASKYIGETEKNLRAVFRNAERSGSLLFFDEADALFGRRTSVKDAHDRYANLETNYLLQRLERYRGVAILATNSECKLPPAFQRRIRATLRFRKPPRAKLARRRRRGIGGEGRS